VNLTDNIFDQRLFYWVPLGFVLFLGVVLGKFLQGKCKKKLILAAKLLGLFTIFNIPNIMNKSPEVLDFIQGNQEVLSFEILVPMILVILLSILFDKVSQIGKYLGVIAFIALIVLTHLGIYFYNLNFTLYGLIGYFLSTSLDLDKVAQKADNIWGTLASVAISLAPFYLVMKVDLFDYVVLLQVLAMYFLFNIAFKDTKSLAMLGKHSLFLYVAHILVIKLMSSYFMLENNLELAGLTVGFLGVMWGFTYLVEKRNWKLL